MKYHNELTNAVRWLKANKKIRFDNEIAKSLKFNKGVLSTYLNGKAEMSRKFKSDFEKFYHLRLEDFGDNQTLEQDLQVTLPEDREIIGLLRELLRTKEDVIKSREETIRQNTELLERKIYKLESIQKLILSQLLYFRSKVTKEKYETLLSNVPELNGDY